MKMRPILSDLSNRWPEWPGQCSGDGSAGELEPKCSLPLQRLQRLQLQLQIALRHVPVTCLLAHSFVLPAAKPPFRWAWQCFDKPNVGHFAWFIATIHWSLKLSVRLFLQLFLGRLILDHRTDFQRNVGICTSIGAYRIMASPKMQIEDLF